ncbi:MAG: alanine--tRNA ligase [Bacteroidales bacterium]|nr:alanine--tRNA ligase [Bacteroidales bacterium]
MESVEIRKAFINFFKQKEHAFVPSSPIVVKNDPTLMFTNAGMNQFKDIFLGNKLADYKRVANSQKCLRVSGKHNDLEEVGQDTYHHTMFEMLGNWSFGDYFKKEAIAWAWEFLTEVLKIDKSRLYVTVFEGSESEGLQADNEALEYWKEWIPENHILMGSRKDNFWEMGDSGPCGPCSEIHIDLRDENEIALLPGAELVNKSHPLVIEIWNLVFIQFNRKADGSLEPLPNKHVDTGMGFERLCMVMQHKKSNYDTDVFQPIIQKISQLSSIAYGANEKTDIAMRVVADHVRAVSFAIADGQLPSNNGAGYVIRRILRRAIRYGYTYLNFTEPFIYKLVEILSNQIGEYFDELKKQRTLVEKVILEEENSFLRTLETGIKRFETYVEKEKGKLSANPVLPGDFTFELYDTYGFPLDLTQIMAKEHHLNVDIDTFNQCLLEQKERSRKAAQMEASDWVELLPGEESVFVGYDVLEIDTQIVKYRKVEQKGKTFYHFVLSNTPFYAESGGQVGDTGILTNENEKISIINTIKENRLIIHIANQLPANLTASFKATVNEQKRRQTERNHSATHLLHEALRTVLGTHVEQRGSLVNSDYLRFDFSHMQKMSDEEIEKVESIVNEHIWNAFSLEEYRNLHIEEAKKMGAMALFGEKYGNEVRVIRFGTSIELCGGTHVKNTSVIGMFKIVSESAIAAGIRRIEAVTHNRAWDFLNDSVKELKQVKMLFNNPKEIIKSIEHFFEENKELQKKYDDLLKEKLNDIKKALLEKTKSVQQLNVISEKVDVPSADAVRDLIFQLKNQCSKNIVFLYTVFNNKPHIAIGLSDDLVSEGKYNASVMIKEIAKEIKGGGGGQPFFATAGGNDVNGLNKVSDKLMSLLSE